MKLFQGEKKEGRCLLGCLVEGEVPTQGLDCH